MDGAGARKGRDLKVEQVWAKDPLYILIRRDALPTRPTAFRAVANPHMFSVEASAPDTPLEVVVTDRFGRKYHQTVERPKNSIGRRNDTPDLSE